MISAGWQVAELSVILVSHNDRRHLERCLDSMAAIGFDPETEVIVVDNKSSDGSPQLVKEKFPWVRLVENSRNGGFAQGCNQGVLHSSGIFILFLNTDIIPASGALELLLKEMRDNPEAGGVGPSLETEEGKKQVSFGKKVDFFSAFIQKVVLNPYFARTLKTDCKKREVGWLSAACLLTRREALEEAGLFDERFFLYFEDIDLCYRIREHGWKLVFLPRARMVHSGGGSTSGVKALSRYHYRKSQLYFYRKHNSGLSCFLLRLYLRLLFTLSVWPKRDGKKEGGIDQKGLYELLKKGRE